MARVTTLQIYRLKISTCGKVTLPDDHTLTYKIGYDTAQKTLFVRLTDIDTGTISSNEWITLADIITIIEKPPLLIQASTHRYSHYFISPQVLTAKDSWLPHSEQKTYLCHLKTRNACMIWVPLRHLKTGCSG